MSKSLRKLFDKGSHARAFRKETHAHRGRSCVSRTARISALALLRVLRGKGSLVKVRKIPKTMLDKGLGILIYLLGCPNFPGQPER